MQAVYLTFHRNLSVAHSGQLCEQMVKEDVMTPLSIMLKEVSAPLCTSRAHKNGRLE